MSQDAAKHALGPWAERVVDSTPETRAELTRNVAAALDAAVAEAVREREIELGRDRGPGCISGCCWGLDDKFHHHPYCETFGGEKPLVMGGRTWVDEGRHNMDVLRVVAGARREERAKALKRINACIRQDTDGETMEALNVWIDELRKSLRRQRIRGDHEHERR